ncbi:MAG TPA: thiolase family protein [Iamia sp.]|jgi:acetyl-CoA C-acetyltransferase|nr:thiolase family protein [Iamia sp.]
MDPAVIVAATRTPIGRAHKGALAGAGVDAFALARVAVQEVVDRAGIPLDEIDDLVLAESLQGGGVIARHTAVELGMTNVPGLADNRHCAAGLSAIQIAAGSIMAGMDSAVIAGGTESLSTMVMGTKLGEPWMSPSHTPTPEAPAFDMALTVGENTARLAGISRQASDEWALQSHRRAAASRDDGRFAQEIVPVPLPDGTTFTADEHPRADTSLERLASLPVLHPEIEGATVTAGNAAGLNDAAAAVVVTSGAFAAAHGLAPQARIRSWASVGVDPVETGLAPTLAIPKALARAGLTVGDVDLFEVNEAFCSVAVATSRRLEIDPEIMNVNGSGCGLGHPIAATGARMVVTMLHELRRRGGTVGCVAMCAGGGMGSALVLELI